MRNLLKKATIINLLIITFIMCNKTCYAIEIVTLECTASSLRIRKNPSIISPKITNVTRNEEVFVLQVSSFTQKINDYNSKWYNIVTNEGIVGWAYGAYFLKQGNYKLENMSENKRNICILGLTKLGLIRNGYNLDRINNDFDKNTKIDILNNIEQNRENSIPSDIDGDNKIDFLIKLNGNKNSCQICFLIRENQLFQLYNKCNWEMESYVINSIWTKDLNKDNRFEIFLSWSGYYDAGNGGRTNVYGYKNESRKYGMIGSFEEFSYDHYSDESRRNVTNIDYKDIDEDEDIEIILTIEATTRSNKEGDVFKKIYDLKNEFLQEIKIKNE